jgi:hypothetical protein
MVDGAPDDGQPAAREVTVDTRIAPNNKGFAMLAAMGWVEGTPVGLSGDGLYPPPWLCTSQLTARAQAASTLSRSQ